MVVSGACPSMARSLNLPVWCSETLRQCHPFPIPLLCLPKSFNSYPGYHKSIPLPPAPHHKALLTGIPHIIRKNLVPSCTILNVMKLGLYALLVESQSPIPVHSPCNRSRNRGVVFQDAAGVVTLHSVAASAFWVPEYLYNYPPQFSMLRGIAKHDPLSTYPSTANSPCSSVSNLCSGCAALAAWALP